MGGHRHGGRGAVLVGTALGLAFAAGSVFVLWSGSEPPERSFEHLAFPLVWSVPALLAALSLRARRVLLLPAGILGGALAFTSFSVTPLLLIPSGLYFYALTRNPPRPTTVAPLAFVVLVPVLLGACAFAALLATRDPACWQYVEDGEGRRSYSTGCRGDGAIVGSGGSTSDTVSGRESALSAALVAGALAAAWTLGAPKEGRRALRTRSFSAERGTASLIRPGRCRDGSAGV